MKQMEGVMILMDVRHGRYRLAGTRWYKLVQAEIVQWHAKGHCCELTMSLSLV